MSTALRARRAGVLLHPTSLPGAGRNGALGADARRFVDWLASGGFTVWQTLPLGPADEHGSPYCLRSAYAGDPRLLDPQQLRELPQLPRGFAADTVGVDRLEAYRSFCAEASPEQRRELARFVREQRAWLFAYGLFEVCAARFASPWWLWPEPFRGRDAAALRALLAAERQSFRAALFEQYLFHLQWSALKRYANERGVLLFGDLPFYLDMNSVEVWWEPQLFALDALGRPEAVAGVPPDYFNEDGQLWGNPLYDWDAMARQGYAWWLARIRAQLARFDLLRIDHFRALESYWAVPAGAATAREGEWRPGRGAELLTALRTSLGDLPLVAEDLGIITDAVRELRDRFALPGMAVLQFAFDGMQDNPHLPANHPENCVVYTGTHDNDTTLGWYTKLDAGTRERVCAALGVAPDAPMPDALIDAAYASRALLAVIPMQDLLGLDTSARMNTPGTTIGNWRWRFSWSDVPADVSARALERARRFGRIA